MVYANTRSNTDTLAGLFGAVGYVIFQWSIGKKEAGK